MKVYLKQAVVPLIYMFFVSLIAMGILTLGEDLIWLKAVLCALNVGLYAVIIAGISYREGQQAIKVRTANDVERKLIVKTGEDRPLKIHEEYKWWKGFLMGAMTCAPMLLLMLVHTILISINPALIGCGATACFFYMAVFSFVMLKTSGVQDIKPLNPTKFYYNLLALPFIMLVYGIFYNIGARKIQRQQDAIKAKHRDIYGEEL